MLSDADGIEFAVSEQVGLVLSNVLRAQPVRRFVVVLSELLDGAEVNARRNRGQIPTLEFLQHRFS